jgi:hypothetical protein
MEHTIMKSYQRLILASWGTKQNRKIKMYNLHMNIYFFKL